MNKRPWVRVFNWVDEWDDDRGLGGWQMRGFESLDPTSRIGLAHDALEHHDATLGPEAEMQAFGAILWGRIQHEPQWHQHNDGHPMRGLVSEVQRFFVEGMEFCTPLKQKPLDDESSEEYLCKFGDDIVSFLRFGDEYDTSPETLCETIEEARQRADDMIAWIRYGYRRVERRWDRLGGVSAFMDAFHEVADHEYTKMQGEFGDKLIVRIWGGSLGAEVVYRERSDRLY